MSLQDRVEALKTKHAALESRLQQESSRPYPDESAMADMKRKKLAIKDELERIGSH